MIERHLESRQRLTKINDALLQQMMWLTLALSRLKVAEDVPEHHKQAIMDVLELCHVVEDSVPPEKPVKVKPRKPWNPRKMLKGPLTLPDEPFITWAEYDARERRKKIRAVT